MSIEQQDGYQVLGLGDDLVLVHGWGVNSVVWQPVVEQLSQFYRIHLVDLPGFGNAPPLSDYSLAAIADSLLAKLPDKAVWCGWSLGGLVATYIASHFPHRVEKLIQVCSSIKFVKKDEWLGVDTKVFTNFKNGVENNPDKTLNRFLTMQALGSKTAKSDIAVLKKLLVDQTLPCEQALLEGLDLLSDVDLRSEFSKLKVPCLSIFGEFDTLVPKDNIASLIALNSGIKVVTFSASSHAPFISETERFNQQLKDFIS